jgi:16S rRNA processing protein RimM
MNKADCFLLGKIIKPHGLKGGLSIYLDVDDPSDYDEMDSFFIDQNGMLEPYFIESLRPNGEKAYITLEEIDTIEKAEKLVGKDIYLPLSVLPVLSNTQFYFHEIEGFKVEDAVHGDIGILQTVYAFPSQNLLAIIHKGKEILAPITDEVILHVDRENRLLKINLPEGLFEIYTDED